MTRIPIKSHRDQVLNTVVTLLSADVPDSPGERESPTIEMSMMELVRDAMREFARGRDRGIRRGNLLDLAVNRTVQEILAGLEKSGQRSADIAELIKHVRKELQPTSEEMEDLGQRLTDSRQRRRVRDERVEESKSSRQFSMTQIGLEGSPSGLLAQPASFEDLAFDPDALKTEISCEVLGDYFPFELLFKDYVFVVDDDGSLFVSVEGLPPAEVGKVEALLQKIAGTLYV